MFNSKRKNAEASAALGQLVPELTRSRERRDRLSGQLVEAQAALEAALVQRRRELVEDDADTGSQGRDEVLHAREAIDALSDAVAQLDDRIRHLESRISEEHDKIARTEGATELAGHTKKLADAIEALQSASATVIAALPHVLGRTPFANPNLPKDLGDLLLINVIDVNLGDVIKAANAHREAILRGDGPIRRMPDVPTSPAAPAPVPVIERIDCLLIADSTWPEGEQTLSAGRWTIRGLPTAIAERAIKLGWVFPITSETVQRLLESGQVSINNGWHSPDARHCVDLATVTRKPPPGSLGRSLGEVDSDEATPATPGGAIETTGPAIVGIASAERVS